MADLCSCLTRAFDFRVTIFFLTLGLKLLIVSNVSMTKVAGLWVIFFVLQKRIIIAEIVMEGYS